MPPLRISRADTASGTRSTPARSRPSRNPSSLPAYESPLAPLNASAQHQLSTLPIRHDLSALNKRLEDAHQRLTGAAGDMNEMATDRRHRAAQRAQRLAERGHDPEGDPEGDRRRRELLERVDAATKRVEGAVRDVVDRQAQMGWTEQVLRELGNDRTANPRRAGAGATQSSMGISQTPAGTAAAVEGEDGHEPVAESKVETMKTRLAEAEERYQGLTMRERYSAHNEYVNFRKILHGSQYPDDAAAPPVPHASTWFDEDSATPRNLTIVPQWGAASDGIKPDGADAPDESASMLPPPPPPPTQPQDDDADSDIEAVAERITIRCPLTLLPMKEPLTSTKCPHAFDRAAIMEYLGVSGPGASQRRRAGPLSAKCPVCEVVLTPADLRPDPVLQRRIRRIQEAEARAAAAEGSDEDDGADGRGVAHDITSSSPPRAPRSEREERARSVKRERMSGVSGR